MDFIIIMFNNKPCRWQESQRETGAGGVFLSLWKCDVHGQCSARGHQQRRLASELQRCQGTFDYIKATSCKSKALQRV